MTINVTALGRRRVIMRHALSTTRQDSTTGERTVPRHDELRAPNLGGRLAHHHGSCARVGHQLLRHRQSLRRTPRRWRHRRNRWQLVRARRRSARKGCARHQTVRTNDRLAKRRPPLGSAHSRRVRRQPASLANRSHRHLPDASRGPHRAVGRNLASDGDAHPAGQDHLRGQQQLRWLAHCSSERSGESAGIPRPHQRAESLQLVGAHDRT